MPGPVLLTLAGWCCLYLLRVVAALLTPVVGVIAGAGGSRLVQYGVLGVAGEGSINPQR